MATSLILKMELKTLHHELRIPLTGILGGITLLNCEDMTSEQREMIDIVKQSSNRLLNFINQILSSPMDENHNSHLTLALVEDKNEAKNFSIHFFN